MHTAVNHSFGSFLITKANFHNPSWENLTVSECLLPIQFVSQQINIKFFLVLLLFVVVVFLFLLLLYFVDFLVVFLVIIMSYGNNRVFLIEEFSPVSAMIFGPTLNYIM